MYPTHHVCMSNITFDNLEHLCVYLNSPPVCDLMSVIEHVFRIDASQNVYLNEILFNTTEFISNTSQNVYLNEILFNTTEFISNTNPERVSK